MWHQKWVNIYYKDDTGVCEENLTNRIAHQSKELETVGSYAWLRVGVSTSWVLGVK